VVDRVDGTTVFSLMPLFEQRAISRCILLCAAAWVFSHSTCLVISSCLERQLFPRAFNEHKFHCCLHITLIKDRCNAQVIACKSSIYRVLCDISDWLVNADVSGFCHPYRWRVAAPMYSARKITSISYLQRLPTASHNSLVATAWRNT